MVAFSLGDAVAIALIFFLGGLVKGVTGMGLPTVAMGLLGALMTPVAAASLLLVPSFVTNIWQLFAGPSLRGLVARLWLMMLGIVAGTIAGSWLLTSDEQGWATVALGAVLVAYAALSLAAWQWSVPARLERRLSPVVGVATGLVTGATGVFVIPAVPYLQALGLGRDDLVQALGLSFTVSTVALALGLASGGALLPAEILWSALAVVPALLGMMAGQHLRDRISPPTFRRWFLVCLLLLGLQLVLRPFL